MNTINVIRFSTHLCDIISYETESLHSRGYYPHIADKHGWINLKPFQAGMLSDQSALQTLWMCSHSPTSEVAADFILGSVPPISVFSIQLASSKEMSVLKHFAGVKNLSFEHDSKKVCFTTGGFR